MSTKFKLTTVLFPILAFLFLTSLCTAADNLNNKTTFRADRAPRFLIPEARDIGNVMSDDKVVLRMEADKANPTQSPGTLVGLNMYDMQHIGSMGRQISFSFSNNIVYMYWMGQFDPIMPGDRHIYYSVYDPGTGYYEDCATVGDYAGYVTCDAMTDGTGMFVCHVLELPSNEYKSRCYLENSSPLPPFLYEQPYSDQEVIWPVAEFHCDDSANVTDDVIYMLTHVFEASDDMILFRKVGGLGWDGGAYIETCANISYTIAADPNSDNVAIVYTDDRSGLAEGDGGQTDMDVYYKLSTDQGLTWSGPINITNYTTDSLWRAYIDISALYTSDGELHVSWGARRLHNANSYYNYQCRLMHWSTEFARPSIIDEATYDMELGGSPCDPGSWNMYIAKMSISQCDNNLYALYTKFGDDDEPGALSDCSEKHYANGELYMAGSDDGGYGWGPPINITNTRTPMCDSTECESDHWATMVRYGMIYGDELQDDTLDIFYINDKDAGAIPSGEGTWNTNNMMHYRFPCLAVEHVGRVSVLPYYIIEGVTSGDELNVDIRIENTGNDNLTIESIYPQYIDGSDWIGIGAYTSVMPPGDVQFVTLTLNDGGVLTDQGMLFEADIIIDSDAPSDLNSVHVELYIHPIPPPSCDNLTTTSKNLTVCNNGNLARQEDGASLDISGDCDADLDQPNGDMYLYDASPMIAWNNGVQNLAYTSIFTQYPGEDGTFKPMSDIEMTSGPDYNLAVCTIATTDDIFGINIELWGPTDGNDFVIAKYEFYPLGDPTGLDQIHLGMFLDWDVPSDDGVDNSSDINNNPQYLWQRGFENDPEDEDSPHSCPITEDQRYAGATTLFEPFHTAWTAPNAPMQQGSGLHPDSLYNRMASSGIGIYSETGEDSVIDLHTGIRSNLVDMSGGDTFTSVFVLATSNDGKSTIQNQFLAAYDWALAHDITPFECLCLPGDANNDGSINVGDAVYIISYVFKGGPAPAPYAMCSGDPNVDCGGGVGDAVYLISYVFKGGPPPLSCWDWVYNCGSPIWK